MKLPLTLAISLCLIAAASPQSKSTHTRTPFTRDQISLYRSLFDYVLQQYSEPEWDITLDSETTSLDVSRLKRCLRGIEIAPWQKLRGRHFQLDSASMPSKIKVGSPPHKFTEGDQMSSPNGTLAISEIAFDISHRLAVVKYGFYCGLECGREETLIFTKADVVWKLSRFCTRVDF